MGSWKSQAAGDPTFCGPAAAPWTPAAHPLSQCRCGLGDRFDGLVSGMEEDALSQGEGSREWVVDST